MSQVKDKKTQELNEVYLDMIEKYQAWQKLMKDLKKVEKSLRQDFLHFADLAKIKKIIKHLND